ncbi:MAG: cytochrome P450, partial [Myxococcota bacterium]
PHFMDPDDPRRRVALDIQAIVLGPPRRFPRLRPGFLAPLLDAGDPAHARKAFLGAYVGAIWYKVFEVELTVPEMRRLGQGVRELAVIGVLPGWTHRLLGDGMLVDRFDQSITWTKQLFRERSGDGARRLRAYGEAQPDGRPLDLDMALQCAAAELLIAGGATAIERMISRLEAHGMDEVEAYRRCPHGWLHEILRHRTPVVRASNSYADRPLEFESRGRTYAMPPDTVFAASLAEAHRDATVFPDADRFDPHRDTSQTLCFHAPEDDFASARPGADRPCPGHDLGLDILTELAPLVVESFARGLGPPKNPRPFDAP